MKKLLKGIARYFLLPLVFVSLGVVGAAAVLLGGARAINDNSNWYGSARGVDESEYVTLGGVDQFIRIRSRDSRNPVLLDLHGGPGGAQTGMTHRMFRPLTEYFTLVEWDQRGAGRSRGDASLVPTMSYQRMVDDTVELIELLKARFGVDKVILVGHSWGSMLGLGVIQQRPDLIAAYVGVGQALAWNAAFDESARLLLNAAEAAGDTDTVEALQALPAQWPARGDVEGFMKRVTVIQGALPKYAAGLHAAKTPHLMKSDLILDSLTSPDADISDLMGLLQKNEATQALIDDLHQRDFRSELGTDYQVPIFIFQGEHDWQTPTTLVKPWFASLNAPHKEYIAFEDSAHLVLNEQPGKYLVTLVERVRPFAMPGQN